MPRLLVAPLSSLPDVLQTHAPSHLISLLSPEHMIDTPAGFPASAHLKLGVNDIVDPAAGTAPPLRQHIDQLLEFSRSWDGRRPMVIHCWAGISRSMASAYAILCAHRSTSGKAVVTPSSMESGGPMLFSARIILPSRPSASSA